MNKVSLVIFDLDGTLIDAYPAITSSFNYTMESLRLPCQPASVIKRAVGAGDRNLLKPFVPARRLDAALAVYRRHHARAVRRYSSLMPGAAGMLRTLKKHHIALAVASNRPQKFSLILLRHLGIKRFFSTVVCKDMVRYGKPHPLLLNTIMRRLRIPAIRTVYVGDMCVDVTAGVRAKVFTVAVATGSNTRQELRACRPDCMLTRIADLPRVVLGDRFYRRNTA